MFEHYFQCPYCWEEVSTYVEDCEVCCNPIEVTPQFQENELVAFDVQSIEQ